MAATILGELGGATASSAGTTIAITNTTGAIIPAGTFIHIAGVWDNINSVTAPTITCSTVGGGTATANHATAVGQGQSTTAGSGVWHQCFRVLTTASIAIGGAIATLTSNQSAVKRAATAFGWSGVTTTLRGSVLTGTGTGGSASATTGGTAPAAGDVVIGSVSYENNALSTGDTDTLNGSWSTIDGVFTTGGNAQTNVGVTVQGKTVTAGGAQTFNAAGAAADTVACVYAVQPVPEPATTQAAYRWFGEGTEAGSTALAAQDTAVTGNISNGDATGTLRIRLQNTNAQATPATDDWTLQWEKNASGTWTTVLQGEALADSYPETNVSGVNPLHSGAPSRGQTFTGNGQKLTRALFWLNKQGTPNGTVKAVLYAHTGTFGTTGVPTGAPLATSTTVIDCATVSTTASWVQFVFDGTVTMTNATKYVIVITTTNTSDSLNAIAVSGDASAPTHAGNSVLFNGTTWSSGANDNIFMVYTDTAAAPTTVVTFDSPNLPAASPTTNRLTGGTGTFVAGEVSEDGVVNDLGWTASNYTEIVYALKVKAADLANGDTLRFRVLRNGVTTTMTYSVTPTINITQVFPAVTQAAYRFYADGTESGSTALAAQDTAYSATVNTDVNTQVRVRLQSTTSANLPATDDWRLMWEKNASGTWYPVLPAGAVAGAGGENYNEANGTASIGMSTSVFALGQSFMGDGRTLYRAGFYLSKNGTPPIGPIVARLYGHTGTFGSTGVADDVILAESGTVLMANNLSTPGYTWYDFDFDGYPLADGTPYVIAFYYDLAASPINSPLTRVTAGGAGTHPGISCSRNNTGTWTVASYDTVFRLDTYGGGTVVPFVSALLDNNVPTTNRLGAGTGSFTPGDVTEDGVANDQGWPGNNYTEHLYSVTLKQADLVNADTLRFRVFRNAATAGMTYTAVPTINVTKIVLTAVQVDRPTTWNIKAAPTITRLTTWDTTQPITLTRVTTWDSTFAVVKALSSTTWKIRQAITKTPGATTWKTQQAITKTPGATTWKTRQAAALTRSTTWDVTTPVTKALGQTTWKIRQAVTKALGQTMWRTEQAVTKTPGATTWKTQQAVVRTRDTGWNVVALTAITGKWVDIPLPVTLPVTDGTTYVISVTTDGYEYGYRSPEPTSQTPNLTGPQGYYAPGSDVFPSIDAGTNHYLIDVVYHAGDPRGTTTWQADQAVTVTRAASWNVAGTRIQVTKTTGATTWNIRQAIIPTRVVLWDTLARITPTKVTTWDVTTPITKALSSTTWRIKQAVATAKSTTWDNTARTTKALSSTTWNIKAAVGPTRSTTWRAAQAVGPTRVVTWDVLTPVAALTRSTTWDNRTAVTIIRGGGDAWSPDDIAGLASWIDGATYAGTVTNKGGGPAFTVGGSPPMAVGTYLNGMPTIRFKTNEGRLRSAWPTNPQNYTLLYLVRWVGPGVGRGFSAQYPPSNLLVGFHTSGKDSMYDNGTWLTGPEGLSWAPWGTGPGPWRMYEADGVDLVDSRFFIDGTLVSGVGPGAGGGLTNGWGISGYEASSSETLDIEVAELLLYDHRLSDVERVQAEDYLTEKWLGAGPAGGGWRVLAPVSLVRQTTWDTARALAAVSVTRSTTWRIKAPILSVRSTTWDTTSTATTIKPTSWDVTSPRTTTRSTTWDAMSPVAAVVRSTTWDATTTTTRALGQTTWKIRVPIANTRSTTWRAEAAVAITRGTTWRAAAATVVPRSTTWDSRFALAITRPTTWDALVVVTPLTRPTTWDVTGTTALVRLTTWDVLSPRAITRGSSTWNIRALVTNTRGTTWAVEGFRATITRVRPTTWNVTGQPVLTRTTTWDSQRAVAVVSRSTTWRAPSPVMATRLTTWQIRPRITAIRSTTWDYLIGIPALTRSTTWRATAPVTITRPTTWDAVFVVGRTRDTTWKIRVPIALTRTTTWDASAVLALTKSTTWDSVARVATVTRSTTWDSVATVAAVTRPTTWNIVVPAPVVTRSTTWDATGAVATARSTTWRARAPVTQVRSTTWNLRAAPAVVRSTTWRASAATAFTRSTTWNVTAVRTLTRPTTWDSLQAITASVRSTTWRAEATTTLTRAVVWDVLAPVSRTRSTTWSIRSAPTLARATSWNVDGVKFQITVNRPTTWQVRAAPTVFSSTTWDTRSAVALTRSTTWDATVAIAAAARSTTWRARSAHTLTRASTWDILIPAPVLVRSTTWRAAQAVGPTRPTSWDSTSVVAKALSATAWKTRQAVAITRGTTWDTGAGVERTRSTTWTTRRVVVVSRSTTWDALLVVGPTRATTWDVKPRITVTRPTTWRSAAATTLVRPTTWSVVTSGAILARSASWNTSATAALTRGTTWDVLTPVATIAPFTGWSIRAVTTTTRPTTWNISGTPGVNRSTTWRSKAVASVTRPTTWRMAGVVTLTRTTSWDILTPTILSRATTWDNTRAVTVLTRTTSWDSSQAVSAARSTTWDSTRTVTKVLSSTTWQIRTAATIVRPTTWKVDGVLFQVTVARPTTWNLRGQPTLTRSTTWDSRRALAVVRSTTWDIKVAITRARSTTWDSRQDVTATRGTTWDIVVTGPVVTRSTTWGAQQAVVLTRPTTWGTRQAVVRSRVTTWDVTTPVEVLRPTTWGIRPRVVLDRSTTWDIDRGVAVVRATTWNVAAYRGTITIDVLAIWQVKARVTTPRSTSWNVLAMAAVQIRSTTWNIPLVVGLTRSTSWDMLTVVTLLPQASWNVEPALHWNVVTVTGAYPLEIWHEGELYPVQIFKPMEPVG